MSEQDQWEELGELETKLRAGKITAGDLNRYGDLARQAVPKLLAELEKALGVISMLEHHWISPMEYYEATEEFRKRVEAADKVAELAYGAGKKMAGELIECEQRVEGLEKAERLVLAANRILAKGTPGSAWMDWQMRAQGVLGKKLIEDTYKDGNSYSFNEIRGAMEDMPRVLARATGWIPHSERALAAEEGSISE